MVFRSIRSLPTGGDRIDLLTVCETLRHRGALAVVGRPARLAELSRASVDPAAMHRATAAVIDTLRRREAAKLARTCSESRSMRAAPSPCRCPGGRADQGLMRRVA